MKKFLLEMLTPEKTFFEGEADSVVVKAPDGEVEILASHAPMVIAIVPDLIRLTVDGESKICANGEGFVSVDRNKVYVLCQTLEWPEDLELDRVSRAIEEHSAKLKEAADSADYRVSKMTLERAEARLKVLKLRGRERT